MSLANIIRHWKTSFGLIKPHYWSISVNYLLDQGICQEGFVASVGAGERSLGLGSAYQLIWLAENVYSDCVITNTTALSRPPRLQSLFSLSLCSLCPNIIVRATFPIRVLTMHICHLHEVVISSQNNNIFALFRSSFIFNIFCCFVWNDSDKRRCSDINLGFDIFFCCGRVQNW